MTPTPKQEGAMTDDELVSHLLYAEKSATNKYDAALLHAAGARIQTLASAPTSQPEVTKPFDAMDHQTLLRYDEKGDAVFGTNPEALKKWTASQAQAGEAVAVIGPDWQLVYVGTGPIAPIVTRHGLKIGSKLYATAPASPVASHNEREELTDERIHEIAQQVSRSMAGEYLFTRDIQVRFARALLAARTGGDHV